MTATHHTHHTHRPIESRVFMPDYERAVDDSLRSDVLAAINSTASDAHTLLVTRSLLADLWASYLGALNQRHELRTVLDQYLFTRVGDKLLVHTADGPIPLTAHHAALLTRADHEPTLDDHAAKVLRDVIETGTRSTPPVTRPRPKPNGKRDPNAARVRALDRAIAWRFGGR